MKKLLLFVLPLYFFSFSVFAKEISTDNLSDDKFHIDCFSSVKGKSFVFRFINVLIDSSIGLIQKQHDIMPQSVEYINTVVSDESLTPMEFVSTYKLDRYTMLKVWTQGAITNSASITTIGGQSTDYQVDASKCAWGTSRLEFVKNLYLKGAFIHSNKSIIYTQPNIKFSTRKYLLKNDEVTIIANSGNWVKINYMPTKTVGWIKLSDIKIKA